MNYTTLHYCPRSHSPLPTHSLIPLRFPHKLAHGATRVTRGEGANRRAGRSAKRKRKRRKKTNRRAFVSGRRAQRAREKNGAQPALAFASERGSHVPAEKRKTVSRKEEGRRKKRKTRTKITVRPPRTYGGRRARPREGRGRRRIPNVVRKG